MANNYLLMAMELLNVSDAGKEFLEQQKQFREDEHCGWEYEFLRYKDCGGGVRRYNDPEADQWRVKIYSEESCNVDALAEVLRSYIKIFDPDLITYFCWASTCHVPRVGEFGGGAFVISDDSISWMNTWAWAEQEANSWKEIRGRHARSKNADNTEVPSSEPPTESSL